MRLDDSLIVKCVFNQNKENIVGGNSFLMMPQYNENFRERNPVICEVVEGDERISKGILLVCQYHHFELDSFYLIEANDEFGMFSIPNDENVFGWIDEKGNLNELNGNIIAKRIEDTSSLLELPDEFKKQYHNRIITISDCYGFKKGTILFTKRYADYEIVYTWNNIERRLIKIHLNDIIGTFI